MYICAGYFLGGFSTCLFLASGLVLVRRFSFPSPDKLLERVMPMLRANSEVRSILGEQSLPGYLTLSTSQKWQIKWQQLDRVGYKTRGVVS